jgi:hypothetical protein
MVHDALPRNGESGFQADKKTFYLPYNSAIFNIFSPMHFCRQLFQMEARTRGNTDPPLATPGAIIPVK